MSGAEQEEIDKMTELIIKGCLLKPINSLHLLNTLEKIYSKVLKRKLDQSTTDDVDTSNGHENIVQHVVTLATKVA